MDLNTTAAIPTDQLLAHIEAFYPGHQIGTCNDHGGEADGVTLVTRGVNINIYHDDGTFGEEGWVVEEFHIATLDPEVTPCANLGEALATFRRIFEKWTVQP